MRPLLGKLLTVVLFMTCVLGVLFMLGMWILHAIDAPSLTLGMSDSDKTAAANAAFSAMLVYVFLTMLCSWQLWLHKLYSGSSQSFVERPVNPVCCPGLFDWVF